MTLNSEPAPKRGLNERELLLLLEAHSSTPERGARRRKLVRRRPRPRSGELVLDARVLGEDLVEDVGDVEVLHHAEPDYSE